jgi:AmmeMemoRadiSam system protein A
MKRLTKTDRERLLEIARRSIESAVRRDHSAASEPAPLAAALLEPAAAFVTIHELGDLRGCIGLLRFDVPLWQNVRDAAAAAALDDPRFLPISEPELPDLVVEVSVLEPPVPLSDPAAFVAGRDGIVVEKGGHRALLLPQVALEMEWEAPQMLEAVCRKAHLPGDAWRDPETRLSVFRSVCFSELGGAGSQPGRTATGADD